MIRRVIYSDKAPKAPGPYCQEIDTENLVFASGQLPIDPAQENLLKEVLVNRVVRLWKI
ncbi:MAG: hypothetical protein HWN70_09945 [Desulfobacterales bacterium]|nr:hypothetical protein [Desulfobacterales bacterium]